MQELVTEYCWGAVWSRPGLARRERSLVNLGMLTALNRSHELACARPRRGAQRLHARGDPGDAAPGGDLLPASRRGWRRSAIAEAALDQLERDEAVQPDGEPTGAA